MSPGTSGDAQAIVDIALDAAVPNVLDRDERYAVVVPEGGVLNIIEPARDALLDAPRRVLGTTTVYDADSLAFLWGKHATPASELYADPVAHRIVGVLNADASHEQAGFRDHRVELVCRKTPAWEAWAASDGRLVDQMTFAEFLEDRLAEVVDPPGATMLELAQSFQASTKVDFKGAVAVNSGVRALQYEETQTARAGQKGAIEIPATFTVALQPFEGGDAYRVVARFRYRIRDGHLTLGYRLDRPQDVLRTAFDDVRGKVTEQTGATVLLGSSAAARV